MVTHCRYWETPNEASAATTCSKGLHLESKAAAHAMGMLCGLSIQSEWFPRGVATAEGMQMLDDRLPPSEEMEAWIVVSCLWEA
jgi:hypothetical protein